MSRQTSFRYSRAFVWTSVDEMDHILALMSSLVYLTGPGFNCRLLMWSWKGWPFLKDLLSIVLVLQMHQMCEGLWMSLDISALFVEVESFKFSRLRIISLTSRNILWLFLVVRDLRDVFSYSKIQLSTVLLQNHSSADVSTCPQVQQSFTLESSGWKTWSRQSSWTWTTSENHTLCLVHEHHMTEVLHSDDGLNSQRPQTFFFWMFFLLKCLTETQTYNPTVAPSTQHFETLYLTLTSVLICCHCSSSASVSTETRRS